MTLLAIPVAALGYCGTSSFLGAVLVFSVRVTVVRVIVSGAWLFPLAFGLISVLVEIQKVGLISVYAVRNALVTAASA